MKANVVKCYLMNIGEGYSCVLLLLFSINLKLFINNIF